MIGDCNLLVFCFKRLKAREVHGPFRLDFQNLTEFFVGVFELIVCYMMGEKTSILFSFDFVVKELQSARERIFVMRVAVFEPVSKHCARGHCDPNGLKRDVGVVALELVGNGFCAGPVGDNYVTGSVFYVSQDVFW